MVRTPTPHSPLAPKARKRFGQNFLVDQGIIRQIARVIGATDKDHLVEIGPGHGAITELLVSACRRLDVVEIDRDLIPMLRVRFEKHPQFHLHNVDALQFQFANLVDANSKALRVVGNLPYNISTPLIFHLLRSHQHIIDMHFMLQKEVVNRLAAAPGDKAYGRLSVMTQYYCQVEALFDVPPQSFSPAPKVDSGIVRLSPYTVLPEQAEDFSCFEHTVRTAFQQRRKTLRNSLKTILADMDEQQLPFSLNCRAEELSVHHYVQLANHLTAS